ncbi:MAG: EamA family transporter RarD [Alteraurantiacibacter sp. bin_em_oilr2.035]|nr:EamA family transporter RarD [Alteraurantiacibacter sp. bin_em_oilr2.035]
MADAETSRGKALLSAMMSHLIWGTLPLYLLLVKEVPVLEFVAWRTVFALLFCIALLGRRQRFSEFRACLADPRTMRTLALSSVMIAINWIAYVWAIQANHVYAASLGYYILPLNMMLLGLVFLGESLSRLQWIAVGLAALGVATLAAGALTTLWVSLLLASSFAVYGLLRKKVNAGPVVGLTIEALILLPIAAVYLVWAEISGEGLAFGRDALETFAIMLGGVLTAMPLLLFATAARALPYTLVGFLQFASPTIVFILGLTVFGEDLNHAQLACFIAIWASVALFSWMCGANHAVRRLCRQRANPPRSSPVSRPHETARRIPHSP